VIFRMDAFLHSVLPGSNLKSSICNLQCRPVASGSTLFRCSSRRGSPDWSSSWPSSTAGAP
jgi:hypothetical protein